MSEQVQLTEAERDALTRALGSGSGCWDFEECCWSSFEAMLPAVEAIVAARLAQAYGDGYNDAATMARCYGHTDHWPAEDEPRNPYLAPTPAAEGDA